MSLQECVSAGKYPLLKFGHHDTGNAQRFSFLYGDDFRWCADFKRWLHWTGKRWSTDHTDEAMRHAKLAMTKFYRQAIRAGDEEAQKFARCSLNVSRLRALLEAAKPECTIRASELDQDGYLLNCKNGTLDLRTLELRRHRREDYITKQVHFNFDLDAAHPVFDAFLERILPDPRVREFVQKALGYSLTGDVSEKLIFFLFGEGNNGKTTLLEAVRHVLKEYSTQVLIDTLTVHAHRENNASLADLADVRGVRFVTTSETEKGKQLAEQKLKYLTGMGEIKACRKYENPIAFPPTFKLFVDANHRPKTDCDDPAFWNRVRAIPFNVTIPLQEVDHSLGQKIRAEAEGVLAWLVFGCFLWQESRPLGTVPEIVEAGAQWRDESDPIKAFLKNRCIFRGNATCSVSALRDDYVDWCASTGEKAMTNLDFVRKLEALGPKRLRRKLNGKQKWIWEGICFAR